MRVIAGVVTFSQIALFSLSITASRADECDPSKILISDVSNRSIAISEKLDQSTSSLTKQNSNKASSGNFNIGNTLNAGGNDSSAFSSAVENQFHLKWSGEYRSAEAYLQLSDVAKEAYRNCLETKTQHIFIYPADNVMETPDTYVKVQFEHALKVQPFKVAVNVDGAKLAAGQNAEFDMEPGGSHIVRISRMLDKPFTVYVRAGNGSDALSVPAVAQTKLVREGRYSDNAVFGHGVNRQVQTKDICVNLKESDDAVIIPDSAVLVTPYHLVTAGGVFTEQQIKSPFNPKQVCKRAAAYDDGTNGVNIGVCAYVYAEVLVRIPAKDDRSSYVKPAFADSNDHDVVCRQKKP